jgi:hypothetical protein
LKRYLQFIKESLVDKEINIYSEKDLHLIKEGVKKIYASSANLTYLSELPEGLKELYCNLNPLKYPIPYKFYKDQDNIWLRELNRKLSSYKHQKKLIKENGIYIMKKYEHHPELINEKIKEENPTYFLSVEYGF